MLRWLRRLAAFLTQSITGPRRPDLDALFEELRKASEQLVATEIKRAAATSWEPRAGGA